MGSKLCLMERCSKKCGVGYYWFGNIIIKIMVLISVVYLYNHRVFCHAVNIYLCVFTIIIAMFVVDCWFIIYDEIYDVAVVLKRYHIYTYSVGDDTRRVSHNRTGGRVMLFKNKKY